MDQFMVRLNGKPKEYMDRFLDKGYFNTKSEVVRLGVMELANKYKLDVEEYKPTKEELIKIGKAMDRDIKKARKEKTIVSEKEFRKRYAKYFEK
ncbi:MAG: hypothetical protein V1824_02255 [archaeon]